MASSLKENAKAAIIAALVLLLTLTSALAAEDYLLTQNNSVGSTNAWFEATGVVVKVGAQDVVLKEVYIPSVNDADTIILTTAELDTTPFTTINSGSRTGDNVTLNWNLSAGETYVVGCTKDPYAEWHSTASETFPIVGENGLVNVTNGVYVDYTQNYWTANGPFCIQALVFETPAPSNECGSTPFTGCEITTDTTFTPGTYNATNITIIGSGSSGDPLVVNFSGATIQWPVNDDSTLITIYGDYVHITEGEMDGYFSCSPFEGTTAIAVDGGVNNATIDWMVFHGNNMNSLRAQSGASEVEFSNNDVYGNSCGQNQVFFNGVNGISMYLNKGYETTIYPGVGLLGTDIYAYHNWFFGDVLLGCIPSICGYTADFEGQLIENVFDRIRQVSISGDVLFFDNQIIYSSVIKGSSIYNYQFYQNYIGADYALNSVLNDTTDYGMGESIDFCVGDVGNTYDYGATYVGGDPYNGTCAPACVEDWQPQYSTCTIGDNQTLTYTDNNACGTYDDLPVDNNTIVSCNYCTIAYTQNLGECVGSVQEVTYTYSNYGSCCALTGLPADCTLPANTTQSCDVYVPAHQSNDITGLVVDGIVEFGVQIKDLTPIIAVIAVIFLVSWFFASGLNWYSK